MSAAIDEVPEVPEFTPMTDHDVGEVAAIENAAYAFPWTRGNFHDALRHGYLGTCVRRGGHMVGYMVAMQVIDEIHLLNVCIAPAEQGLGLGRAMMLELNRQARAIGALSVLLEVRPSNARAIGLYERLGYQPIGRRKAYYPAPGNMREDAIVMRLSLASDAVTDQA